MAFNRRHKPDEADLEAAGHVSADGAPDTPAADEADLDHRLMAAEADLESMRERYQRALADFKNYQTRAIENERQARIQGASDVLHSIIRILDHFDLALGLDPEKATAAQVLGGVRMIRDELMRQVAQHGAVKIEPAPGEEFDPRRHEAVQYLPAPGVAPGHVSIVLQPGYSLGERVLRPAKVAVAPPGAGDEPGEGGA